MISLKIKSEDDFKKNYGCEPIKITDNYVGNTLSSNYTVYSALGEIIDNSLDARLPKEKLVVEIKTDEKKGRITFSDNGKGVEDTFKLFQVGGTDKAFNDYNIGKYGQGALGAFVALAKAYKKNKNEIVQIICETDNNGEHKEYVLGLFPNGNCFTSNKQASKKNNKKLHGTKFTITNVKIENTEPLLDYIKQTYEFTYFMMLKGMFDIKFNGRPIFESSLQTFTGNENRTNVNVGNQNCYILYKIIAGKKRDDDRKTEEAAIGFYDKRTGRLLAKDTNYWKWFSGRQLQPSASGLKICIFIDTNMESYEKFGIISSKDKIKYRLYYKLNDFKELKETLCGIYTSAVLTSPIKSEKDDSNYTDKYGNKFAMTNLRLNGLYSEIGPNNYVIKEKYKTEDAQTLISENIELKKEIDSLKSEVIELKRKIESFEEKTAVVYSKSYE